MAMGLVPTVYLGSQQLFRAPLRLDALQSSGNPTGSFQNGIERKRTLNTEVVKQLARGSVSGKAHSFFALRVKLICAGFCVGVVLAFFSKTLALLGGLVALSLHVSGNLPQN